jgi:ParB family chromosome partitioning protein
VEELVRQGSSELRVVPDAPETAEEPAVPTGTTSGTTEPSTRRATIRKLPEPGVLELEDLLSTYLNTRVKVDIQNRRGRLVVEFATLEDLERIYRAMVGDGGVA